MRPARDEVGEALRDADTRRRVLEALRAGGLFGALGPQALDRICDGGEAVAFRPGEVVVRQGDEAGCAYVVLSGSVRICLEVGGRQLPIALIGPGNVVGEMGALSRLPRTATAVCEEPVRALRIDDTVLSGILADFPDAAQALIGELCARIARNRAPLAFLGLMAQALERGGFDDGVLDLLRAAETDMPDLARVMLRLSDHVRAEQQRRAELAAAARIQQSILPRAPPTLPDGTTPDVACTMIPAREVGGDFFDHFLTDDGRLALVVADASGKGIPAALFSAMASPLVRSAATAGGDAAAVAARVNDLLARDNDACMFVTLFLGLADLRTGRIDYVNAGHNAPYVVRADGSLEALGPTGPALGMWPGAAYRAGAAELSPGDRLFAFTDGVTEAADARGVLFGEDRLERLLSGEASRTPAELRDAVVRAVAAHAGEADPADDVTVLAYGRAARAG